MKGRSNNLQSANLFLSPPESTFVFLVTSSPEKRKLPSKSRTLVLVSSVAASSASCKTVLQEAEDAATEETRPRVRDLLGSFLFTGEAVQKKTKVLSGGERNRLALCKLLLRPFNTLIMDEPTNHLDIQSKEIIKIALQKFEGTVIVISHDREFLQGLCDKIFEFRDGTMKEFLGNINEYLEYRQKETIREISAEKSKLSQTEVEPKVEKQNQTHSSDVKSNQAQSNFTSKEQKNLQNKLKKLEEKISDYEKEIASLEVIFAKTNPSQQELEKYETLKKELTATMQDWEEIALQIE